MKSSRQSTDIILLLLCLALGLVLTVQHTALLGLTPAEMRTDMPGWMRQAAQSSFRYIVTQMPPGRADSPMEAMHASLEWRRKNSPFRIADNARLRLPEFMKSWLKKREAGGGSTKPAAVTQKLLGGMTLSLGGIFSDPEGTSRALINDEIVAAGGVIGGYTVETVEEKRVVLIKGNRRYELTMASGLIELPGEAS